MAFIYKCNLQAQFTVFYNGVFTSTVSIVSVSVCMGFEFLLQLLLKICSYLFNEMFRSSVLLKIIAHIQQELVHIFLLVCKHAGNYCGWCVFRKAWFAIDLGVWLLPTCYTLRHARGYGRSALRNWLLQVSKDSQTWITLFNHSDDTSLNDPGYNSLLVVMLTFTIAASAPV